MKPFKVSKKERIPFVRWCLENGYPTIAVCYADYNNFPELFPESKLMRKRFCNDKRSYYRDIYLKTDHWKELKNKKLESVSFCEICGKNNNLDVHHLCYRNLYDVELSDLKVLCRRCHDDEHNVKIVFEKYRSGVRTRQSLQNSD